MENCLNIEITCELDKECGYYALVTYGNHYTCGVGYNQIKEYALLEACTNARPFITANGGINELTEKMNFLNIAFR